MSTKLGADWIPSLHPSNPYSYSPEMIHASRLPPKQAPTYAFFFGYENDTHEDPIVGLQQWYPAHFRSDNDNGAGFITTEHYMMYHKALVMGDAEVAAKILQAPGRVVKNFNHEKWDGNADRIVEEANWLKFSQIADLREVLLATGDKTFLEASEEAMDHQSKWGTNRLGKALMEVREKLRDIEK